MASARELQATVLDLLSMEMTAGAIYDEVSVFPHEPFPEEGVVVELAIGGRERVAIRNVLLVASTTRMIALSSIRLMERALVRLLEEEQVMGAELEGRRLAAWSRAVDRFSRVPA